MNSTPETRGHKAYYRRDPRTGKMVYVQEKSKLHEKIEAETLKTKNRLTEFMNVFDFLLLAVKRHKEGFKKPENLKHIPTIIDRFKEGFNRIANIAKPFHVERDVYATKPINEKMRQVHSMLEGFGETVGEIYISQYRNNKDTEPELVENIRNSLLNFPDELQLEKPYKVSFEYGFRKGISKG